MASGNEGIDVEFTPHCHKSNAYYNLVKKQIIFCEDHLPIQNPHEDFDFQWDFHFPDKFVIQRLGIVNEVQIHRLDREDTRSSPLRTESVLHHSG